MGSVFDGDALLFIILLKPRQQYYMSAKTWNQINEDDSSCSSNGEDALPLRKRMEVTQQTSLKDSFVKRTISCTKTMSDKRGKTTLILLSAARSSRQSDRRIVRWLVRDNLSVSPSIRAGKDTLPNMVDRSWEIRQSQVPFKSLDRLRA